MNRTELSQLLLENDIPVEMRMMICKLADLGVEIDEGVSLADWPDGGFPLPIIYGRCGDLTIEADDIEIGDPIIAGESFSSMVGRLMNVGQRYRIRTIVTMDEHVEERVVYAVQENEGDVMAPETEVVSFEINLSVGNRNTAIITYRTPDRTKIIDHYLNPSNQQLQNLQALIERDA